MGEFFKGFINSFVYVPVIILLFFGVMYLIKIYFELKQVKFLLKVNESATRELCEIMVEVEKLKKEKNNVE